MDLPDEVLRKLYYENALRLYGGLPRQGFGNIPAATGSPPA
jgi:hypothetical protein